MQTYCTGFNPDYSEEEPTIEQISALSGDAILEFGAPWCSHCQSAKMAIQTVLSQHATVPHIKVYDGKGKVLGRHFKVKLWPTLVLLKEGKEVARIVRPVEPSEVSELLAK